VPVSASEIGDGHDCSAIMASMTENGSHMGNEQQNSESGTKLVVVLETNDQIQLAMAKGLIEDAGIPLFIQGQMATLYQSVDGFLRKWVRLQVPEDRAAEAQELLEQLKPRPYLC
jgi:hypothetical protein